MLERLSLITLFFCCASTASAATFGLPILKTEPTTVFVVNQFDGSLPTPSYTITVNAGIASAQGAPGLLGQNLAFSLFLGLGFDDGTVPSSLKIGGTELLEVPDPLDGLSFLILPPDISEVPSGVPGEFIFSFGSPYEGYGPVTGTFPGVLVHLDFGAPLPTKTGYLYCSLIDCSFESTPGLTELFGEPVISTEVIEYVEGQLPGAVVTLSNVNGRQPAPIPVPAGGILLASGLFGIGLFKLRAQARR